MPADLGALSDDLAAETDALEAVLQPVDDRRWQTPTPAVGWRVHDQVSHLAYFDQAATNAASDPDKFRAELAIAREQDAGMIRGHHALDQNVGGFAIDAVGLRAWSGE